MCKEPHQHAREQDSTNYPKDDFDGFLSGFRYGFATMRARLRVCAYVLAAIWTWLDHRGKFCRSMALHRNNKIPRPPHRIALGSFLIAG